MTSLIAARSGVIDVHEPRHRREDKGPGWNMTSLIAARNKVQDGHDLAHRREDRPPGAP